MTVNMGQAVAEAWERHIKNAPMPEMILDGVRPTVHISPRKMAAMERRWKREDRIFAAKRRRVARKFLGRIVKAKQDAGYDICLTFADGRVLRILSEEYRWEKPRRTR